MAGVRINSGKIEPTSRLRDVPQPQWHNLMLMRRMYLETRLPHDCRCLVEFVADAEIMHQQVGFKSTDDMIRDGLGLEPSDIRLAIDWLKRNDPEEPVPIHVAVWLGQHGGDRGQQHDASGKFIKGTGMPQDRKPTLRERGREYDLARLRRDRPDLADRVEAGELSANAAAIEAGFRKKRRCKWCGHEL